MKREIQNPLIAKLARAYNKCSGFDLFYIITCILFCSFFIGMIQVTVPWYMPGIFLFFGISFCVALVICDMKRIDDKSKIIFMYASGGVTAIYSMWFIGQILLWLTI